MPMDKIEQTKACLTGISSTQTSSRRGYGSFVYSAPKEGFSVRNEHSGAPLRGCYLTAPSPTRLK